MSHGSVLGIRTIGDAPAAATAGTHWRISRSAHSQWYSSSPALSTNRQDHRARSRSTPSHSQASARACVRCWCWASSANIRGSALRLCQALPWRNCLKPLLPSWEWEIFSYLWKLLSRLSPMIRIGAVFWLQGLWRYRWGGFPSI